MSAVVRGVGSVLLLTCMAGRAPDLVGQTITGRALVAAPRSSVRLAGVPERVDGFWTGFALDLRVGRFTLSGSGTRGSLKPDEAGTVPKVDVGEMSVSGGYEPLPWLRAGLEYTARAFSSPAGFQRWHIVAVRATASHALGTPALRAFATLAYLPVVSVSGQRRPASAVGSDVGIAFEPGRSPIIARLDYRIERFSFPPIAERSEQFEAVTVSVGVRVQRQRGRWTLGGRT